MLSILLVLFYLVCIGCGGAMIFHSSKFRAGATRCMGGVLFVAGGLVGLVTLLFNL